MMSRTCYEKLGLKPNQLRAWASPLYGMSRKAINADGMIELPVKLGSGIYKREVMVDFIVADLDMAYNIIVGRKFLTDIEAVISIKYLVLKYPVPEHGTVGSLRADQKVARECYNVSLKSPCHMLGSEQAGDPSTDLQLTELMSKLSLEDPDVDSDQGVAQPRHNC